jgi:hypothetical protein
MTKEEVLELIVKESKSRTWGEYGELAGVHKDRVRSWYRNRYDTPSAAEDLKDLANSTSYEYKDDEYKLSTYYDHPPQPDEVIKDHKIDTSKWKLNGFYSKAKDKGWHVTAWFTPITRKEDSIRASDIDKIVQKYVKRTPRKSRVSKVVTDYVLRIIISDIHIGMDVTSGGTSLYGGKWDKAELMRRGDTILQEIAEDVARFNPREIIISELGDYMDGYEGTTTRKSHSLPQNMSDVECFELGVEFKMYLIDQLYESFDIPIKFYNTVDDNHGGKFSSMVNLSVQRIVAAKYEESEVLFTIFNRFIGHYFVDNFLFIQTHGKDATSMSKPFPVHIDKSTSDKILEYMKHHKLYGRGYKVEVSKGDSHQALFDETNVDFDYFTYPAFSPSSGWVQINFNKGKSGFVKQVLDLKRRRKTHTPIYFDWVE